MFTRKQQTNTIVPRELASIYHALAAPEPDAVAVPEPFPHVRWNNVRFKPALPNPELVVAHSYSQDPDFYQDAKDGFPCTFKRWAPQSFGTLHGFKTSLGIVAVPSTPVGGYVYCPDARQWVIHAENRSSASEGRERRRGGGTSFTRRKKG